MGVVVVVWPPPPAGPLASSTHWHRWGPSSPRGSLLWRHLEVRPGDALHVPSVDQSGWTDRQRIRVDRQRLTAASGKQWLPCIARLAGNARNADCRPRHRRLFHLRQNVASLSQVFQPSIAAVVPGHDMSELATCPNCHRQAGLQPPISLFALAPHASLPHMCIPSHGSALLLSCLPMCRRRSQPWPRAPCTRWRPGRP